MRERERQSPSVPPVDQAARRAQRAWLLVALGIFTAATLSTYWPVFRDGSKQVVLAGRLADKPASRVSDMNTADLMFETWLVFRHAHTFVHSPLRLFQAEHCAPEDNSLVFGIPMITMGILAIPFYLATGEPVQTFNLVLLTMTLIGAIAMYLLIVEWTKVPGAGIVAGLLFCLHPIRMLDIAHPSVWDTAWTLISIFFLVRLFARGHWLDAIGLSIALTLQIWASIYPFLAAIFLMTPVALWLCMKYRLRNVSFAQLLLVAASGTLAAAILFLPYLEARGTGQLRANYALYLPWRFYSPDGIFFMSWTLLVLSSLSLIIGRKRALGGLDADPRWALLAGIAFVAIIGAGPYVNDIWGVLGIDPVFGIPSLGGLMREAVPGVDSIRGYARIGAGGVQLGLCVLAGIGAAGLIRVGGRYGFLVAAGLIVVVAADTLRPHFLGLNPRYQLDTVAIRPSDSEIAFYQRLEDLENRGPIFQVPGGFTSFSPIELSDILLSAFHHRRTSACFGSHRPASQTMLSDIAKRLPSPEAFNELQALGFTTIVIQEKSTRSNAGTAKGKYRPERRSTRFRESAEQHQDLLRRIHSDGTRTAYALLGTGQD